MTGSFKPTSEQQRVIDIDEGAWVVKAPPGSGKTMVLTQRIIRLLRRAPSERFRILALTFTTRAADEMRRRLEAEVGEQWRRVTATTFHAFCLDVLRHHGDPVGVGETITIYEREEDRLEALARALVEGGLATGPDPDPKLLRAVLAEIGRMKRQVVLPEAVHPEARVEEISVGGAYEAYEGVLRRYQAVDFDDLLLLTLRLFIEQPRIARHYRRLFKYIFLDEAQDTSRAQYDILKALCGGEHRNVMLVADTDQSIFRFTGASPRYIGLFLKDFSATEQWLTGNFRCARAIVDAANELISKNPGRQTPVMKCEGSAAGKVIARICEDEEEEARLVVGAVQRIIAGGLSPSILAPGESGTTPPEEIAILARSRYLLTAIRAELERCGIRFYFNVGQSGLFESHAFRLIHFGLRVVENAQDAIARSNLVGEANGAEGVLEEDIAETAAELMLRLGQADAGEDRAVFDLLTQAAKGLVRPDAFITQALAAAKATGGPEEQRALEEADASAFKDCWSAYQHTVPVGQRSFSGFLGELSLAGRSHAEDPGVRVLTLHAAKGQEFRVVFLVGMNQGSFPDFRSLTGAALEEERRNAYVAITRAGRELNLTRARQRLMPWGSTKAQRESQFLGEAGISMSPTEVVDGIS